VRPKPDRAAAFLLAGTLAACSNNGGGVAAAGSHGVDSGGKGADPGVAVVSDDSGTVVGSSDAPGSRDSLSDPSAIANGDDAGQRTDVGDAQPDAGAAMSDGGGMLVDRTGGDGSGGVQDVGSCCMEQSTPGCSNASLEVCVCEKDQSCCTMAWGPQCVLIVEQKYCQPGVRDCVCGTDAGQWGQTQCCSMDWTSTCDSVATLKCNAVQGCF